MCKTTTVIAKTSKGHRVFLQGLTDHGFAGTYDADYNDGSIRLYFHGAGKRKVTQSKGGVIDLESKKVTRWADGATVAHIEYVPSNGTIIITKEA